MTLFAMPASAQDREAMMKDRKLFFSFAVTPYYQSDTRLDSGGEFKLNGAFFRFGIIKPVDKSLILGFRFAYNEDDYDFSGLTSFGGLKPWGRIKRFGVSTPITKVLPKKWLLIVTPSLETLREQGADRGDSFAYGAAVAGLKTIKPGRKIGVGAGVFNRLEDIVVFPFVAVDWRVNERLRLRNPFAAGPTGPAGIEAIYDLGKGWQLAGGAAYRSIRFRLDGQGVAPNGIGQNNGVPTFLRVSRELKRAFRLDLYAGAILGGELQIENQNGDRLASDDYETAPFAAFTFNMRF
ncbi:MAG: DUF6268 family outer membrane beta-barrel protein [Acidiferrobacterales bacterium]